MRRTTKVRLTSRWWCLDCDENSDWGLDMGLVQRLAQAHTKDTGHATMTSTRPLHR